jgi:cyclomaltodextrinase / maltogenic alpha-amylase / neopullulanase
MTIPSWVQDSIFYQIFPDRFANGDPSIDPPNVQPWGSPPSRRAYQGGDLKGITDKLDYLLDLGINAIYLNPIFQSAANHRYHTNDYFSIDPLLGSLDDFHNLIATAHRRNIRVILDGVFNHCGRGFFAFNDLLENEAESPYIDWFHVRKFPLRAFEKGRARNYAGWWGFKDLPKFNTHTPAVRRYLLSVARYWIEQGADGWRLDVPNEIDDDSFWDEFRHVVRSANPEAYLVGEIWEALPRWVNDSHFDGLMNYPLRTALLACLSGKVPVTLFAAQVEALLKLYPREHINAMYNLIGSHDTERTLTLLSGDANKLRLAYLFLFAYPGVPSIYYGDEIGVEGGRDPDCRRAFPWDTAQWNVGLRNWVKRLTAVRKFSPALRSGEYLPLLACDQPSGYAFARTLWEESIVIAVNPSDVPVKLTIPVNSLSLRNGAVLHDLLGWQQATVKEGNIQVTLEPFNGAYLKI